jgi:alpha-glucosidase
MYRVRLPEEDETNGVAPQAAAIGFPWQSPWRVVIAGPTLGTIVESTAVTDLSPAATTTDVAWIKPGRASWSWWSDTTSPRDYQKLFPFVGLASQLRWEYSQIGDGWPEMENGGDVNDLLEYSKARNVDLTLWYGTGGAHAEGSEAAPSVMLDSVMRRVELKRIAALGVKGITVDVLPSDKQNVIGLYEDILRDAAANHLFVDFHGSTIPRGWRRTFPNLLSMAAVRGAEAYSDSSFEVNAPIYNTIYPFTRNVIGPMDYGPLILGDVLTRRPRLTTNAHELALSVVFESGLQHFASTPQMVDAQPEYVKDFLRIVPTVWDETRFVDGYPGKFVVLARRRGPDWYVGAITADTLVSVVEVPLSFLGAGSHRVGLISDGEDFDQFASNTETLTSRDTVTVELAPSGGFVAQIRPVVSAPTTPDRKTPATKPTPAKPTPAPPRASTKPRVPPRRAP